MNSRWNERQTRLLVEMWNAGTPTSIIAANVGKSAAACRHKAERLGLSRRCRRQTVVRMRTERRRPHPAPVISHPANPGGCQYIYGDPKKPGWHYCGEDTLIGQSWCKKHYSLVFTPYTPKPRGAMTDIEIIRTRRAA